MSKRAKPSKTETYRYADIPVVLHRKVGRKVWSAKITLGSLSGQGVVKGSDGSRVDRGTGEQDLKKAILKGYEIYADLKIRIGRGESVHPKPFDNIAREYLSELEKSSEDGLIKKGKITDATTALERYYIPFFKQQKIDTITKADLLRYDKTRERYHLDNDGEEIITYIRNGKSVQRPYSPKQASVVYLRKERQQFNDLMKYAVQEGYVRLEAVPRHDAIKGMGNVREAFSQDEISHLQKFSAERIRQAKHRQHRRQWIQNHYRFLFIYLTGCRPQEIAKLQFSDLEAGIDKAGEASFLIALKKRHLKNPDVRKQLRKVVPQKGFRELITNLKDFYKEFDDHKTVDEDYIFHNPNGAVVNKTAKTFKNLLISAGFLNEFLTLYSLRHTFITERLYEKQDADFICRWAGTSLLMLDRHYSHVKSDIEHLKPRPENTVSLEPFTLLYLLGGEYVPEKKKLNMFEMASERAKLDRGKDEAKNIFIDQLANKIIEEYEYDFAEIEEDEAKELVQEQTKDIAGFTWHETELITEKVMEIVDAE